MSSFTTVFRAIVMLIAAILVVKGWQSYGPSTEQLKTIALRALEAASVDSTPSEKDADRNSGLIAENATAVPLAPPLADTAAITTRTAEQMPRVGAALDTAVEPAAFTNSGPNIDSGRRPDRNISISGTEGENLSALLERLKTLGGMDHKLTRWGSTGGLYRFSCRAAIADTSTFARHFESVSRNPRTAVEDVVAKVEAWRTAHFGTHSVR